MSAAEPASGIPRACAEKFWRENEAVRWVRRGQPVMRWKPLLEAYAAAWARIEAQRPQRAATGQRLSDEEVDRLLGGRAPHRLEKAAREYPEPPITKLPRL
jgi:hypothetical protein